jgi:hypothetical protein
MPAVSLGAAAPALRFGMRHETALEALVFLATVSHGIFRNTGDAVTSPNADGIDHFPIGLPFMPLDKSEKYGWRLRCPLLGRDGRCTDYENRPALCRHFQPGSNRLWRRVCRDIGILQARQD